MLSDVKDFIVKYMSDIEPIKDYKKKLTIDEKYPGYNGLKFDYSFSPLSINQISINSGFKIGSVMEVMSEMNLRVNRNDGTDDQIDLLSYDLFFSSINEDKKEPLEMNPSDFTNEELINIAIFKEISKNLNEPSDLFSTIFHVKNRLGLPDDFMPGKFITLGERPEVFNGKLLLSSSYIKNVKAFYFFSPIREATIYVPFAIYPSVSSLNVKESEEFITDKIRKSFADFQKTDSFERYSRFRALKNFCNKLKMKKTGIIQENFLTANEIEEGLSSGYIMKIENSYCFKEGFGMNNLNEYMDRRRNAIMSVGREWMGIKPN